MSENSKKNSRLHEIKPAIALLLTLTIAVSLVALPSASAHTPPWNIATQAYVSAVPQKLGVGQSVFIVMWAFMKMPGSDITNNLRMQGYMLNITLPDGTTEVHGPFTPDPTETTFTSYTPEAAGEYSLVFYYPDTIYVWNDTSAMQIWTNDIFLGSVSAPVNFTVQQEPVPGAIDSYPLPTAYWTRPIEAQNTNWYTISSNWLGIGSPQLGTTGLGTVTSSSNVQPDGTGPNSAHVMWTKPIQAGGIVGGTHVGVPGNQFYTGQSYNQRFQNPIILQGVVYYREPAFNSGGNTESTSGDTVAVDLRTGKEIWRRSDLPSLSFGMTYDFETANQEGVLYNGILFSANFANAFDPRTGDPMFSVTGVPSTTAFTLLPGVSPTALFRFVTVPTASKVLQPDGSILTYYILNAGNATNPDWYLSEWNSSKLWTTPSYYPALTSPVDGGAANMYDYNISIPFHNGMPGITEVLRAFSGDMLLGINGTIDPSNPGYLMWGGWNNGTANPYTIWAVNLNASRPDYDVGDLLWIKTYTAPSGFPNTPVLVWPETIDRETGVFTMYDTYDMTIYGYSIDNGDQLWGPITEFAQQPFNVFTGSVSTENTGAHRVAYGNLYMSGYGGLVYAFNYSTGVLEWTYGNGGEGNSTVAQYSEPWGYFPIFIAAIADGKLYCFSNEHSPTTPLYKGPEVRALNATTGQEIWTLMSWDDGGQFVANGGAVADGEWVYDNVYDMQIYAIGRGPSQLTVTAPNIATSVGTPIVIRGTVMDISAGTTQSQQAADFPNGVPAVSDDSQSAWMPYVYMQKPRPINVTGVPVSISVIDSNNNYRDIGTTTSDSSGMFTYAWAPDIPGSFTVIATFAGSNSYWPSSSETSFYAITAPAPTSAPTPTPAPMTDMYIAGFGIAILIVIVAIGVIIILMLRRR